MATGLNKKKIDEKMANETRDTINIKHQPSLSNCDNCSMLHAPEAICRKKLFNILLAGWQQQQQQ